MAKRVQNSFGKCHVNEFYGGIKCSKLTIPETKYALDYTRKFYLFDIVPMGAVRMTNRDRIFTNPNHSDPEKRQRPAVAKYFAFKTLLSQQATEMGYTLGKHLDAVYLVPMPTSWSAKKKKLMNKMPCEAKPDCDNITKAIKDTLKKNDAEVWWEKAEKRWAYNGSIIIFE